MRIMGVLSPRLSPRAKGQARFHASRPASNAKIARRTGVSQTINRADPRSPSRRADGGEGGRRP